MRGKGKRKIERKGRREKKKILKRGRCKETEKQKMKRETE